MKSFIYRDNVFSFEGAVSVQVENDFCAPWRILYDRKDFYPFLIDGVARAGSGVRLSFTSDTENIALETMPCPEGQMMDLFVNDEPAEEIKCTPGQTEIRFKPLPAGEKRIEIWLSQKCQLQLKKLLIDDTASIRKSAVRKPRWVHYGSSISHCGAAHTPSKTWLALTARKLGLHLTSFGFSGQCHLDVMIGRIIRDLPADYITLKLGINTHSSSLTERTFPANAIGLINIIREKHPLTPLTIISPIISPPREKVRTNAGLSLEMMRDVLKRIVDTCRGYGDTNIWYVDGKKVFGEDLLKYLPDELHPSGDGQFPMSDNFVREVFGLMPS